MADRYWVGGTATWDATAGTKWSATSGGAGGATVPTSVDDVFFNASSGTGTVTISSATCRTVNCTGFTGTWTGFGTLNCYGGLTFSAGMTSTWTSGNLYFYAASGSFTVTTAGKTVPSSYFGFSGTSTATWTLGDAFNCSSFFEVRSGTFTTNSYNLTVVGTLYSSYSNTRAINFGSSTVTCGSFDFSTNTNLTFNAGTSSITITSSTGIINGGSANSQGLTFYNVSFSYVSGPGSFSVSGINTFNNFSVAAPSSTNISRITFNSRQTINGVLSTTGTAGNRRVWFCGVTTGLAQTLTCNSPASLTDADFSDIYITGTASPISGTRIGDRGGVRGVTASTPKTVYWSTAAGGNWSGNNWAATSGGAVNTDNFPLAQDTAVIGNTGLNVSAAITLDTLLSSSATSFFAMSGVDMSTRTNAMTLQNGTTNITIHGDWINGSGTSLSGTGNLIFSGRNTQNITSAGKTFTQLINVDSYGGTVQLADALNVGTNYIQLINGTFNTKNYNVNAGYFRTDNGTSNPRALILGSSTVTITNGNPILLNTLFNLTFDAGTSQINVSSANFGLIYNLNFYNVSLTSLSTLDSGITGTFNNLTIVPPASTGNLTVFVSSNITVTGTLTCAGASPIRRITLKSNVAGTQRDLTVGTLSANDCDFRDIEILGAAIGTSPTRAGDCGGNNNITFPSPKTVYWNLAGTQTWSATGWATSSGGTPNINNFPLAQDTAVFNNTGSAGTVQFDAPWNIGTFDSSARTSAMTLAVTSSANLLLFGDWKFGTGVTTSTASVGPEFVKNGTQTITSNGVSFNFPIVINSSLVTVQLADALTLGRSISLSSGTFDAVSYNVTASSFSSTGSSTRTLKMGSGTWTVTSTSTVWNISGSFTLLQGTANIVLSSTSTSSRTFSGGGYTYNKLTIGGATGSSTTTLSGSNYFTELASTKTVAHTIDFGTTSQVFGKWTVTGTLGNVVTLTGTSTSNLLWGDCTSGIDYLAMGSIGFLSTSPAEFYAGANSTGTAGAPVYRTAKPANSTRYWVGGTGNWSSTTKWSTSSGGASGASVPRSHDDVIFNSASSATAYTATVDAVTGGVRCKSLTISGPASGNVTLAGSAAFAGIHGNVTLPATGLTRSYTGNITLSSSSTGLTFTTNGVSLASTIDVRGVGCEWSLGSALTITSNKNITLYAGGFNCATYNLSLSVGYLAIQGYLPSSISLGTGTITIGSLYLYSNYTNLTFNAGTSQLNIGDTTFYGGGRTFYNVSFTLTNLGQTIYDSNNTFNNLTVAGSTVLGINTSLTIYGNQTINGTFTCSAGTSPTTRRSIYGVGAVRTLTCAAFSATDVDFTDITIAGAAAPVSGTRLGDCKGNSGITFPAAKTVYCRSTGTANWSSSTGWSATNGGASDITQFPLAQDTAVFPATTYPASGSTITMDAAFNTGTIDMSARTTNTMTLFNNTSQYIFGNFIMGTGATSSGAGALNFYGRGSQTITSAGRTLQAVNISSPGGSVTLNDAFLSAGNFDLLSGTFNTGGYAFTLTSSFSFNYTNNATRILNIGSSTMTIPGTWNASNPSTATVTGTGTISMNSAGAHTFAGGDISYSNITLNQANSGTLTITGNNTFKDITNSYSATGATTINIGTTTQTVTQWTGTGTVGKVLTVTGSSSTSPGTLILTGAVKPEVDYLNITGVRAYSLTDTWYAGANSTNNGSLGWYFSPNAVIVTATVTESATGTDVVNVASLVVRPNIAESATGTDSILSSAVFRVNVNETGSASDLISALQLFISGVTESSSVFDSVSGNLTITSQVVESATASDLMAATAQFISVVDELGTASDSAAALKIITSIISESSTASDSLSALALFQSLISEGSTVSDAIQAASTFIASTTETSTVSDSVNAPGSIYNTPVVETVVITDALLASFLWNLIADGQTPNWENISTSQSTTWTNVDDSQTPNWQNINTLN